MIRKLNSSDKLNFLFYCQNNKSKELYITKNNRRLFLENIKIAEKVFGDVLKRGDKCIVYDDGMIRGLILLVGYSEKSDRKYLRIIGDNKDILRHLFKYFFWNYNGEIYMKLKKSHPTLKFLEKISYKGNQTYKFNLKFMGDRGQEVLLFRPKLPNFVSQNYVPHMKDKEEYVNK